MAKKKKACKCKKEVLVVASKVKAYIKSKKMISIIGAIRRLKLRRRPSFRRSKITSRMLYGFAVSKADTPYFFSPPTLRWGVQSPQKEHVPIKLN